jgi:hypothetical protein
MASYFELSDENSIVFSFLHMFCAPEHFTLVLFDCPNYLSEAFIRTPLGAVPQFQNTLPSTLFQTVG